MKQVKWFLLIIALIVIDQTIKWWLLTYSQISNQLLHVFVNNKFIFGYGPSADLFFWIAIFVVLICAIIIMPKETKTNFPFTIMLAGASSNLIDRFFRGGVIDYFKINFFETIHFNLADLYLIFGLIFLSISKRK